MISKRLIRVIFTSLTVVSFGVDLFVNSSGASGGNVVGSDNNNNCSGLLMGQYRCLDPDIDAKTQQPVGCTKEKPYVKVSCLPAPGLFCNGTMHNGTTVGFRKEVPCKWTSGHSFETALLLSIFLGMFGIDRFYLGYPAIGLLKFCTLGFMFLGQLIDIILIAMQVIRPSDGSSYVIDYYGAGLQRMDQDENTYFKPQDFL